MQTVEQVSDVPVRDNTNNASTAIKNEVPQMERTGDDIAYLGNTLKRAVSVSE